jgi:hypothetical protein
MAGISREKENIQNDLSVQKPTCIKGFLLRGRFFFTSASSKEKLKIISVFFFIPSPKNHFVSVHDFCVSKQLN